MRVNASRNGRRAARGRHRRARAGRFFVPDHSSYFAETGDLDLYRFFEAIHGPGAPSGWLIDGRPFVHISDIGDGWCCDHFWIDPAGLENASAEELAALIRCSDAEWPTWVDPAEIEVSAVAAHDDRGRRIWDVRVAYSLHWPDD